MVWTSEEQATSHQNKETDIEEKAKIIPVIQQRKAMKMVSSYSPPKILQPRLTKSIHIRDPLGATTATLRISVIMAYNRIYQCKLLFQHKDSLLFANRLRLDGERRQSANPTRCELQIITYLFFLSKLLNTTEFTKRKGLFVQIINETIV